MKYFGTDGFRGEANKTLTADQAYAIGKYMGWYFSQDAKSRPRIVVGRDTRRSGQMFEAAIVAGLNACGADAYLVGVLPTPSISYLVETEGFTAGVMITASHNPFHDNGIKLIGQGGGKMSADVLEKIETYIDGLVEIDFAYGENIGKTIVWDEGKTLYLDHLQKIAAGLDLRGQKIALDCANGAASSIVRQAFENIGAQEIIIINDTPDGLNINVDCGSTHIEKLSKLIEARGDIDCGFAFDGDADRCIAVDGQGKVVNGDKILYVCGKNLSEKGQLAHDMIVTTVMANIGFDKAVEAAGLHCEHTSVGDKYVHACMCESGYVLGGEQSGHIIFADCENTGDGIVTAFKVLHATQDAHQSLAVLADELCEFPQLLVNVRVPSKQQALEDTSVRAAINKAEQDLGDQGRILVRPSGTEPLIRVLVEAATDEACQTYCELVAKELRAL